MKMKLFFILILVFTMNLAAQQATDIQNNQKPKLYKNYLYNFSFEMPSGWIEHNNEDSLALFEASKKQHNKTVQSELEKSMDDTQILLNISKFAIGTPDNASMIVAVEVNRTPQATIEQTAAASERFFNKDLGYEIVSNAKRLQLGNQDFMMLKLRKEPIPGVTVFQTVYLNKTGNQVLQFVLSYIKPSDGELMEKSLQTLKFQVD